MLQYTIKRLLIMIPTFFVVSVVIFLILNLAPGRPGQAGDQGISKTAESVGARESYRIFKEQFNLDKPVFFNTRFAIDRGEVEGLVAKVVLYGREGVPPEQQPRVSEVVRAQDRIEDLGQYIVPHLYTIAREHDDPEFRWYAVQRLTVNARRRLIDEFSATRQDDATRQLNRAIDAENTLISAWSYPLDASEEARAEVMARWEGWYEEHKGRFTYGALDKAGIFFTDTRFAKYWSNLARLDLGVSNIDRKPVLGKIMERLSYSLTLSLLSVFLIYLLAVPMGVFSAVRQGSPADQVMTVALFMMFSLPSFFTGVLLLKLLAFNAPFHVWPTLIPPEQLKAVVEVTETQLTVARAVVVTATALVAVWLGRGAWRFPEQRTMGRAAFALTALVGVWLTASLMVQIALYGSVDLFPAGGFMSPDASEHTVLWRLADIGHHLVLPVFCMTYGGLAILSRYARSGLLDVIRADYIRTARAKGLSEPVVIIKHATRNGMIPILTLLGTLLPTLIGGSVIIEIIFNIPGMGLLLFEAITTKDYNIVMGVLLISSVLTLVGLLLSDISYALVDPQISFK